MSPHRRLTCKLRHDWLRCLRDEGKPQRARRLREGGEPAHLEAGLIRGLRLKTLHAETPQPAALRAVLEALDVKLTVGKAAVARLVAVLDTPNGPVTLMSA